MYAKFGKLAYLLLLPLVAVFFYLVQSRRARVIVLNEKGEILLVRSWFGHQEWSLPGGGINIGETPQHAAERELREETSITGVTAEFLGEQKLGKKPTSYRAFIFKADVNSNITIEPSPKHRREIIDTKWFPVNKLPKPIAVIVTTHLKQR